MDNPRVLLDHLTMKGGLGKKSFRGVLYKVGKTLSGEDVFEKEAENTITIGLAQDIARYMVAKENPYNNVRHIDKEENLNLLPVENYIDDGFGHRLFGYAVSTDGGDANIVYPEKKADKGYDLNKVIPFRRLTNVSDDDISMHDIYTLRHLSDSGEILYYLKQFESIDVKNIRIDGGDVPDYPDENMVDSDVNAVIDLNIKITKEELREHFILETGTVDSRHYNAMTLFMGKPVECLRDGVGVKSFRNIFSSNRLNMSRKDMGSEGVHTWLYRIYI